jgi:hypothetical protein
MAKEEQQVQTEQDQIISVKLPGAKKADFHASFLRANPKPPDWGGTDAGWIKRKVKEYLQHEYRMGKLRELQEQLPTEDVLTDND